MQQMAIRGIQLELAEVRAVASAQPTQLYGTPTFIIVFKPTERFSVLLKDSIVNIV